jgi:hypothetical protein
MLLRVSSAHADAVRHDMSEAMCANRIVSMGSNIGSPFWQATLRTL